MTSPLRSLISTGTKLWLDSIDPDLVVSNRALGRALCRVLVEASGPLLEDRARMCRRAARPIHGYQRQPAGSPDTFAVF